MKQIKQVRSAVNAASDGLTGGREGICYLANGVSETVEDLASFDSPNPDVVQSTGIIEPDGAWHP